MVVELDDGSQQGVAFLGVANHAACVCCRRGHVGQEAGPEQSAPFGWGRGAARRRQTVAGFEVDERCRCCRHAEIDASRSFGRIGAIR